MAPKKNIAEPKLTRISSQPSDFKSSPPSSSSLEIQISEVNLPLKRPNRDRDPNKKTLLDVIQEKRPKDAYGNPIKPSNDEYEEIEIFTSPFAQAFFWAVPMSFLLYALDVVVHQQYRQDLDLWMIFWRCVKNFPVMMGLLYIFHPRRHLQSIQFVFLMVSLVAGFWLVHAVNTAGYYKVMKKAPPVGTLWIWAACEMELPWLVVSCLSIAGFTWWNEYTIL